MHGTYVILGQISKHKTEKWADETEKSIGKQIEREVRFHRSFVQRMGKRLAILHVRPKAERFYYNQFGLY